MKFKPWPLGLAWFGAVAGSLLLLLGIFNAVANTANVGSYLPLLVLMPLSLYYAIRSIRAHGLRRGPTVER